ncbi:MAG TPA: helix-turn-helix transcriptional regulator [Clostridia bacterium]|nr:helix-turn-helix transcriptional regulator [Clostridia bacterium]
MVELTINQILKEKGFSHYSLSKSSRIPWATLAGICSGKTHLERCSAGTLMKLSKALELTFEELLSLEAEPKDIDSNGKPTDKSYLETDLPGSLQKAIDDYIQGEKEQVLHLDCLADEVYGSINANFWGGRITEEQAVYLRKKYLYGEEDSEND